MPELELLESPKPSPSAPAEFHAEGELGKSADRRRSPTGPRFQLKEMRSQHMAILRCKLKGMSNVDIAEMLGVTPQNVTMTINSDLFKIELRKAQLAATQETVHTAGSVVARIDKLMPKAVDVLEDALNDPLAPTKIKVDVAKDVLNRGGVAPVQRIEHGKAGDFTTMLSEAYAERKAKRAALDAELVPVSEPPAQLPEPAKQAAPPESNQATIAPQHSAGPGDGCTVPAE